MTTSTVAAIILTMGRTHIALEQLRWEKDVFLATTARMEVTAIKHVKLQKLLVKLAAAMTNVGGAVHIATPFAKSYRQSMRVARC